VRRQAAGEELEHGGAVEALAVIAGCHRQLVEVAEQRDAGGVEQTGVVGVGCAHPLSSA
jgi:hypothetical protein